jgi:hypothetical protein
VGPRCDCLNGALDLYVNYLCFLPVHVPCGVFYTDLFGTLFSANAIVFRQ